MKYYKSKDGLVFAYELDGSQDEYIPTSLKRMTKKEVENYFRVVQDSEAVSEAKAWRLEELNRADIELSKVLDGMGTGTEKDWRDYRCSLRNWPSSESFPTVRPTAPDA